MGICCSSKDDAGASSASSIEMSVKTEKEVSRVLDRQIRVDKSDDNAVVKLLLLGAGGSGKSTLFKQMIGLYGAGFPERERRLFIPIIHSNVFSSMRTLIAAVSAHGGTVGCIDSVQVILTSQSLVLDEDCAAHVRRLWQDPGIQSAFENSARFQLMDSTSYFMEQVEALAAPNYIPSMQDVLRSRVRTTGIAEQTFSIAGYTWRIFDVGGQRNERRKWLHCFDAVTAVIFVGVLSEYDLVLEEDTTKNRMVETLELFDNMVNSHHFRNSSMVLFLNKRDLFAAKIKKIPLTVCPVFAGYQDQCFNYKSGCAAIEEEFLSRRKDPQKLVYVHVTCATDTDNISNVFNAVRDTIVRATLQTAGILA